MLYLCVPSYNEAPTVGLLLWRVRQVFQEFSREYEVLVFDDASTDGTRETLEPYARLMPLTILGASSRVGYARAVDALLRAASERTRYPRRDAVVLLQADLTDQPEHLPDLVKRFEGGADVVVAERIVGPEAPERVRRLARLVRWLRAVRPLRRSAWVNGVQDPFGGFRLFRVSVLRDLVRDVGDRPLCSAPGWAANAELLRAAAHVTRRVECVAVAPRWDLRPRESRIRPWSDALELARRLWAARRTPRPAT